MLVYNFILPNINFKVDIKGIKSYYNNQAIGLKQ